MAPVQIELNERPVYEVDWLEDCYKKVSFPNPKCEKFLAEVNKRLSHKIRGELVRNKISTCTINPLYITLSSGQ